MNPFTILAPPLGQLLALLYNVLPNYGIAIILLTIAVSLVLFPLTLKQTRSMKAMQEIQPEVKQLQKELKGDREELNKRLMELYKERGVNPAAGCLPLILQMPVWFGLYRVLRVKASVDIPGTLSPDNIIPIDSSLAKALVNGHNQFLGMDLLDSPSKAASNGIVSAIPYLLLIAAVVATGFYQTYQTTKKRSTNGNVQESKQGQQMQTVAKIMPLFLGFISWGFPTGLVLYFAVSNLFRIGQQALIFRMDDDDNGQSAKKSPDEPQSHPEGSGRSPHASKKRKGRRRK